MCYDIRGPVMDEANRMIAAGMEILKLNIGNPAVFGFRAPNTLIETMSENLENTEGYSDSKVFFLPERLLWIIVKRRAYIM